MADVSTREGYDVRTDSEIRVNTRTVNIPTIAAIVISTLSLGIAGYTVYSNGQEASDKKLAEFVKSQEVVNSRLANLEEGQEEAEASYATRRGATDARFQKIEANMEPMGSLVFRVQQLEQSSNKLADALERNTDVTSDMRIAVGILSQKVDGLASDKRAELHLNGPPIMDR